MRVYAVASGKGGVGKTTTVANLGAVLAAGGHETVVVDADLGMGNLAGALGVDADDGPTVHDVLAGRVTATDACREGPVGLEVLPASDALDDFGAANPSNLAALLDGLDAEVVLVDTSAGLSHDSVEPLRVADEVLLVSTPERGALNDTAKTRDVTGRFDTPVAGAVVTRVTPDTDPDTVADHLGVPVRGTIPDDPAVSAAADAGDPLVVAAPDAPATDAYRRLAADLTGDESLKPADDDADAETEDEGDDAVADDGSEQRTGFLRWLLR
ncbi:nucleotide-binding protein [Haloplanus natans]|uniref:nucleotide-binding protein n=1 Tax=Haloplanus natans TaxID=376171 RepID=UPI000677B639|nr:P-loop NTPase [Haloplanus natans]